MHFAAPATAPRLPALAAALFIAAVAAIASLAMPALAGAAEYVGLVHPKGEVALSMGVGGVVSRLTVRPGQAVRAGQPLLTLDDRQQTIEVTRRQVIFEDNSEMNAAAERSRALETMVKDTRRVFESTGSISRDEMSKLDVEYVTARGRYEQLQAQKKREKLEYDGALQERALRTMTAPLSGVITRVEPKVGEWAKPGETLMMLVDAANCYLTTNVPLSALAGLKQGQQIAVKFEAAANVAPVNGRVGFISSVADAASGLVEVRVELSNPGLKIRPGIKGMIELPPARR